MEKGGWSPSQEEGQGAGAIPTGLDLPHPALRKHSQHLPKRFTVAQSGGPFPLLGTRLYPGKAHPPQRRFGTPSDTLASHSLLPSLVSPHPYLSHCSGLSAFALPPPPPPFHSVEHGHKVSPAPPVPAMLLLLLPLAPIHFAPPGPAPAPAHPALWFTAWLSLSGDRRQVQLITGPYSEPSWLQQAPAGV